MIGNRQSKSSYVIGNKGLINPQHLGVKYNKPSSSPNTLSVDTSAISDNEHNQQSIYVPLGLKQPKELNSKKYNSLEKIKR